MLATYVSGHGYGHATRVGELCLSTPGRRILSPRPMTARKVLLVANLVLVLAQLLLWIAAFAFAGLLGTLFTRDFFSWWLLVIPASGLLGAAIILLTVWCLRAFDPRLAVAIAVLSVPVYVALVLGSESLSPERRLATTFVNGDAASSADARAKLEAKGHHTNNPAVPVLLEGLRTAKDPARLRATIELLGAVTYEPRSDSPTIAALAPYARRPDGPGPDTALRATALAAMNKVSPAAANVISVRYEGLTDDGLATFHLPKPHPVFGESVSVVVDGLVLPRPGSSNPCEIAAAQRAGKLIADALPPRAAGQKRGGHTDLREVRIRDDGEFIASVSHDGLPLSLTLMKDLPWFSQESAATHPTPATIDWCKWTATPITR